MLRGVVYLTGLWVIVFRTDVVVTLIVLAGKSIAQP